MIRTILAAAIIGGRMAFRDMAGALQDAGLVDGDGRPVTDGPEATAAEVANLLPGGTGNAMPANRRQRGNAHAAPLSAQDLALRLDEQEGAENGVRDETVIKSLVKVVRQAVHGETSCEFLGKICHKVLAWPIDLQRVFIQAMCDAQRITYDIKLEPDTKSGERIARYNGPVGRAGLVLAFFGGKEYDADRVRYRDGKGKEHDSKAGKRITKWMSMWNERLAEEKRLLANVGDANTGARETVAVDSSLADRLAGLETADDKKTVKLQAATFKALYRNVGDTILTLADGSKYMVQDALRDAALKAGTDKKALRKWIEDSLAGK